MICTMVTPSSSTKRIRNLHHLVPNSLIKNVDISMSVSTYNLYYGYSKLFSKTNRNLHHLVPNSLINSIDISMSVSIRQNEIRMTLLQYVSVTQKCLRACNQNNKFVQYSYIKVDFSPLLYLGSHAYTILPETSGIQP